MSEKEQARIEFHKRRELETNEHDFAFLDGFDAGAAHSAHRVEELVNAERKQLSEKLFEREAASQHPAELRLRIIELARELSRPKSLADIEWQAEQTALSDGPRS